MHPAAGASHLVPVVLGGLRPDLLRQVAHLMGEHDAQVSGPLQVRAARTGARGEQVLGPVRVIVPRQVRARRPGLLPGFRFPAPRRGFGAGGVLPGWSSPLGAIEEFPLLREISRSSRAIRSAWAAT